LLAAAVDKPTPNVVPSRVYKKASKELRNPGVASCASVTSVEVKPGRVLIKGARPLLPNTAMDSACDAVAETNSRLSAARHLNHEVNLDPQSVLCIRIPLTQRKDLHPVAQETVSRVYVDRKRPFPIHGR